MDAGHELTESDLRKLEKRINGVYATAQKELKQTAEDYFKQFEDRDKAYKERLKTGKITPDEYRQWRINQMARGKRFVAMRDKMAERATEAHEVALSYINDFTPGIYTLNRNFAAWQIEQSGAAVSFTMFDESTVRRLIGSTPDVMPYYPKTLALRRGFDLEYGKKQITAQVTSSILQGKSIPHLADDLQKRITTMSRTSAVRSARTATTAAQNGGRLDAYKAAEDIGLKVVKQWIATLDERTRESHREIDGERAETDAKFSNGLRFPGDPNGAAAEVYNCRCTMKAVVLGSAATKRKTTKTTGVSVGTPTLADSFASWLKKKAKGALIGTVKSNN